MSIAIVTRDKSVVSKKGKKFTIIDGEEVKQFWFQEEVWEIIKEFLITNRSRLLLKMKKLPYTRLSKIYWNHFSSDFSKYHISIHMNDITPLEERKNFVKRRIIKGCENPTKYAEVMEKEFQVKQKDYEWLKDFAVGEEVIVREYKSKNWSKRHNRKGIIRKIGKTIQVELYDYERISGGMFKGCPFDYDSLASLRRLVWLESFEAKVTIYSRNAIIKRGDNESFDALFVAGRYI